MKSEHLEDTLKKGRFCFNHSSVFNHWEKKENAQYDPWDAHIAFEARHIIFAPIIGKNDGKPVYDVPTVIADKGIVHIQTEEARKTPICCYRMIEEHEVAIIGDRFYFSLGDITDRIINEFGHDSFIMIYATPFLERLKQKYSCYCGAVEYNNSLKGISFAGPEDKREFAEQLFLKDERFKWQKEYRIPLPPSENSRVFIELGSIEDIAICGKMIELRT